MEGKTAIAVQEDGLPRRAGRRKLSANQNAQSLSQDTKADIVAAATREFVKNGFEGASINAIADATETSKRMLYYHFGSKRGLYLAAVEAAYERVGRREPPSEAPSISPMEQLRQYAEEAYDNFRRNEDFVRMVMAINLNKGAMIGESDVVRRRSVANMASLEAIWNRGCKDGSMRGNLRILDLYLAIIGVCFHAVSNRVSTSISLGVDLGAAEEIEFRRRMVGDVACLYAAAR